MPPPRSDQSVFDVHGAWLAADGPADLDQVLAAAHAAYTDLVEQLQALEFEIHRAGEEMELHAQVREHALRDKESLDERLEATADVGARRELARQIRNHAAVADAAEAEHELLERQQGIDRAEHSQIEECLPTLWARIQELERMAEYQIAAEAEAQPGGPAFVSSDDHTAIRPTRYFRLLVWNLENFTRDPRPRGPAPISALRNQARIAVVARLFQELGTDVLLVMETGRDVGEAMTAIGQRITDVEVPRTNALVAPIDREVRPCEPLVSPATHAVPPVELDLDVPIGRMYGDRVIALRALQEVFAVSPHPDAVGRPLSEALLGEACRVLVEASPGARSLRWLPHDPEDGWIPNGFAPGQLGPGPGSGWLYDLFGLATQCPDDDGFYQEVMWPLQRLGDALVGNQSIEAGLLAELVWNWRMRSSHVPPGEDLVAGVLAFAELTGLLLFAAHHGVSLADDDQRWMWVSEGEIDGSLAQATFVCTVPRRLSLSAHDRDVGALGAARDPELTLGALVRLGAVETRSETYGMVFRPRSAALLDAFLGSPCREYGFQDGRIYGILREAAHGDVLRVQAPGDPLNGRSALLVQFPIGLHRWVTVALHHNRFSGNAAVAEMDNHAFADNPYTKGDNVLRARSLSLVEIARACAGMRAPALIVGDFNLTRTLLMDEPMPADARAQRSWRRAQAMRRELRNGMHRYGYLRRRPPGPIQDPATSLSGHRTIASGGPIFSQPYDAVYQPIDYMAGDAAVRSAPVRTMNALIPDDLLDTVLEGPIPPLDDEDDVDIEDESDEMMEDVAADEPVSDDAMEESSDDAGGPPPTLWNAIVYELQRVYRSLHRQATKAIRGAHDWRRREIIARLDRHRDVEALTRLGELERMDAEVVARARALYDALQNDRGPANLPVPHPLEDWIAVAEAALHQPLVRPPQTLGRLVAELRAVRDQLLAIEQDHDVRLWIAYRAIVSDHVPVAVEIDTQPY